MNYQEQLKAQKKKREQDIEEVAVRVVAIVAEACATLCLDKKLLTAEQCIAIVNQTKKVAEEYLKKAS